eukprot:CAMPEP_0114546948 /NCGR_PEP_ID=MMETSP0114-20121206/4203_1 /TAXON_ID=31324 /ORGANISM="Goniomonas sp, Strain m" /LENGTH=96 /DNA_ID=CAMNT_0001731471 /DNA_START=121 /DNA_END=411 /DNA_ORIENTATION=-
MLRRAFPLFCRAHARKFSVSHVAAKHQSIGLPISFQKECEELLSEDNINTPARKQILLEILRNPEKHLKSLEQHRTVEDYLVDLSEVASNERLNGT